MFLTFEDSQLFSQLGNLESDGMAFMTGEKKGVSRCLEELLQRTLQLANCL